MLRRVASIATAVVLLSNSGFAKDPGETTGLCPAKLPEATLSLQRLYKAFKQSIEAGPFFTTLVRKLGRPANCVAETEDGAVRLSYTFARGGALHAERDPAIEFTEQRMTVRGLDGRQALALLRAVEKRTMGQNGCGITWHEPPTQEADSAEGTHEVIYGGEVCNCQGRLVYHKNAIVGLVFKSTC